MGGEFGRGRLRTPAKFGLVPGVGANCIRPPDGPGRGRMIRRGGGELHASSGYQKERGDGGRPTAGLPSRRLSWSYTDLCIGVQRLALDLVHRLSAANLICRIPNQPTIHPNLPLYDGVIAMVYFSFEYVSMPVFPL